MEKKEKTNCVFILQFRKK